MLGVLMEFQYTDGFDRDRIVEIARRARTSFEGMSGLRQKTFAVDEQNRGPSTSTSRSATSRRASSSARSSSSASRACTASARPSPSSRSPSSSTTAGGGIVWARDPGRSALIQLRGRPAGSLGVSRRIG